MMTGSSTYDHLLYSTVRLEVSGPNTQSSGTAFVFSITHEGAHIPFLVTNKHVVTEGHTAELTFTAKSPDSNGPLVGKPIEIGIDEFEAGWEFHADDEVDIAVMAFGPTIKAAADAGKSIYYRAIDESLIPTPEQINQLTHIEQVYFIGYPNAMYDKVNLTPITRVGMTATPISLDYCGRPAFLIDASVFPGSSGSPVLIFNQGSYATRDGGITVGTRLYFLGTLASVFFRPEEGEIEFAEIPTRITPLVKTRQMIDLGLVFKSHLVSETARQFVAKRVKARA
jgi:hypothetical protein